MAISRRRLLASAAAIGALSTAGGVFAPAIAQNKPLRIGVLALKQAQGRLDADVIRGEGDRLLATLEERLGSHQSSLQDHIAGTMRDYFDPRSGRFNERVERLVKDGGDLERLLKTQIGDSDSVLEHEVGRVERRRAVRVSARVSPGASC